MQLVKYGTNTLFSSVLLGCTEMNFLAVLFTTFSLTVQTGYMEKQVWVSRGLQSGIGVPSWMCLSISPDPDENKKQVTIDYRSCR